MRVKCSLTPVYEIPTHCLFAFFREYRGILLPSHSSTRWKFTTRLKWGVLFGGGGARFEELFSGRCFLIRLPSPEDYCGAQCLLTCPLWRGHLQSWKHKLRHAGAEGLGCRRVLPGTMLTALFCCLASCWEATNRVYYLTTSFLCVLFFRYCHHFFSQNKYLMLLLSLHLIKTYRICAVNSNETNKTRPPLLKAYVVNEKCHYRLKNFAVNRAYGEKFPL